MATPAEATSMATQADATSMQRKPQLHQVYILYVRDEEYEKGQELEVYGYPPVGLQQDDRIVFIPFPPGKLELTFEYGSNFTDEKTPNYQVMGQEPQTVRRLQEMTDDDLEAFKLNAVKQGWARDAPEKVEKNAFPFLCRLTPTEYSTNSVLETPPRTYTGGFPHKPSG